MGQGQGMRQGRMGETLQIYQVGKIIAFDCSSDIKTTFPTSCIYLPLSEGTDLSFRRVLKI